jgi:protein phosphatase
METVQVDVEGPHPLERGDIFLLCSDGLSGQVNDRVIGSVVAALPPKEAVQFLVHLANLQGGPDNTTVVVVRVGGEPRPGNVDSQAEVIFPGSEGMQPIVPRLVVLLRFLGRLPWAFLLLALGILLEGLAVALAALENSGTSMFTLFMVGGVALLGGILTLMVQNIRETRKKSRQPEEERTLQVYRQAPCPLDAAIYERLVQSAQALEESIKQRGWDYDVKTYQDRLKHAAQQFKQQHLRDAFREQCRAMLVLMEAVHHYRGKNEDFQPLWDKPTS